MLVLLIIFMIVTPIIAKGFQATIPRSANPENRPQGPDEIRLGIDHDGKFFLDAGAGPKLISEAELPDRLASPYASRTMDTILVLNAGQNLGFPREQTATRS